MCHYLIAWPVFGIIVGAIARFIMPGTQPMGWLMTMVLGIAGSVVGGALMGMILGDSTSPGGWVTSVLGAFLLLYIYPKIVASNNKPGP